MTNFLDLQNRQQQHDRHYHADIDNLPLMGALHHFGEHLTKYAGRLMEQAGQYGPPKFFDRIVVDSFIIVMGIANRLNVNLNEAMSDADPLSGKTLLGAYVILNGRRAAASEKVDHLEDYSFKEEMIKAVAGLAKRLVIESNHEGLNLELEIEKRWHGMESKSFLPKPRTPLHVYVPETSDPVL